MFHGRKRERKIGEGPLLPPSSILPGPSGDAFRGVLSGIRPLRFRFCGKARISQPRSREPLGLPSGFVFAGRFESRHPLSRGFFPCSVFLHFAGLSRFPDARCFRKCRFDFRRSVASVSRERRFFSRFFCSHGIDKMKKYCIIIIQKMIIYNTDIEGYSGCRNERTRC